MSNYFDFNLPPVVTMIPDEGILDFWRVDPIIMDQLRSMKKPYLEIKKIIFNDPATIIIWRSGAKTVVKCGEGEQYDPEKGMAMAICKYALGNKGRYYEEFKKWLPKEEP